MTRPFERRRAERKLMVLGGTVQQGETRYPCLIKDLSETGLFLYSNFVPQLGEAIQISFAGVAFHGSVVRVEANGAAATGIGIRFTPQRPVSTEDGVARLNANH